MYNISNILSSSLLINSPRSVNLDLVFVTLISIPSIATSFKFHIRDCSKHHQQSSSTSCTRPESTSSEWSAGGIESFSWPTNPLPLILPAELSNSRKQRIPLHGSCWMTVAVKEFTLRGINRNMQYYRTPNLHAYPTVHRMQTIRLFAFGRLDSRH